MSYQIYSNDKNKYYGMIGMNGYVLAGNVNINAASGNSPTTPVLGYFNFISTNPSHEDDNSICTIGETGLTIKKEGMYSISLNVGFQKTTDVRTGDIDIDVKMLLTRTGDFFNGAVLDRQTIRQPLPGSTPGSTALLVTLSYVGYLKQNDYLLFETENYTPSAINILGSVTQLYVNKIY